MSVLNVKLAVFVGAGVANASLPNIPLLDGALELLPNTKSGCFAADSGGFVLAEKLKLLLAGCCAGWLDPNVGIGAMVDALLSFGLVVENIAGVVVPPNAGVLVLFPKAGLLDEPNGRIIELDEPNWPPITVGVCPGELNTDVVLSPLPNTGNFVSCVPKIGLFSGAGYSGGLLAAPPVNTVGLSACPNVIGTFESLLLNNDVELETIWKAGAVDVSLATGLSEDNGGRAGVVPVILFSPNDKFVESAGDGVAVWPNDRFAESTGDGVAVWPKFGTATV